LKVRQQAMDAALALTGSCSRSRAIAAAFAALAVAGCSADMTRFDSDPFARVTPRDVAPVSVTGTVSAPGPGLELRPKADLVADVRPPRSYGRSPAPPAMAGTSPAMTSGNAPVRIAALGDVPVRMPPQEAAPVSAATRADAPPGNAAKAKRNSAVATARRSPAPPARKTAARGPVEARVAAASAGFDWPVHGPVVARFGAQRDGLHSGGIAIAVAEGTPIRSAADGVVIYAGSGLKSFGNLALVRHADNYVTAYGHAKELAVKRGDQVKRGDVIGRSGQTGQASTPRVHFEIRKDSAPVDPMPLLKRSSASLRPERT
jgi:murein DD-endopeptidase MepM/ murein hydrolase activator NlpD